MGTSNSSRYRRRRRVHRSVERVLRTSRRRHSPAFGWGAPGGLGQDPRPGGIPALRHQVHSVGARQCGYEGGGGLRPGRQSDPPLPGIKAG